MPDVIADYETRLQSDYRFQVEEVGRFVNRSATVHEELVELVRRLDEAAISYAVIGALALGRHGFVRATVDIDLLLTKEGLDVFHQKLIGLGYRPLFPGARKKFRATDTGVRIDVITAGEYPGDGTPKAVVFPDPDLASVTIEGIRFVSVEKLVELKIASGTTAPHRIGDLADVINLIKAARLPLELKEALDPSVRAAYDDLWRKAQVKDALDEEPSI